MFSADVLLTLRNLLRVAIVVVEVLTFIVKTFSETTDSTTKV